MQEFIAYAKANPGKLNFGTSGIGSMVHLSAELLMKETGIKMQHLPYKGGSNSMADLLGGTIDALFVSSPVAVGQAENKDLKMLAVTSRYRLQALPNVPTVRRAGVPGFDTTAWLGVMGPAGLPPTIRQKLSTALMEIARDPDTQANYARSGSSRSAKTRRRSRNSSAATSRSGRSLSRSTGGWSRNDDGPGDSITLATRDLGITMGPTCLNGIVLAVCRSQAQAFNRSRLKNSGDLASHRVRLPGGFFNSVRHWAGSSDLIC